MSVKVSDMYSKNSDLKPHAKFVGQVSDQISAEHPDWTVDQVLAEVPARVRKSLGLKASAMRKDEIAAKGRPSFPTRGTGVRPIANDTGGKGKGNLTPEQQQIEDLITM
jgi:hypothetical protein